MAYTTGATAPADCLSGNQISTYTIGLLKKLTITGLSPSTQYSFRLCAANSDETAFSAGTTITTTTPAIDTYIFVTATTSKGGFGGLAGANTICQNEAAAAGLSGTWVALLSDSTTAANSFITIDTPVYNMQDYLIANDSLDFWGTNLFANVIYGATGANIGTVSVWTGTYSNGSLSGSNCNNWTSNKTASGTYGLSNQTNSTRLSNTTSKCDSFFNLYCISQ